MPMRVWGYQATLHINPKKEIEDLDIFDWGLWLRWACRTVFFIINLLCGRCDAALNTRRDSRSIVEGEHGSLNLLNSIVGTLTVNCSYRRRLRRLSIECFRIG